ncbi:hypothetical protein IH981_02120 [Patescibacteria group bacterium]|nr:hypothetical protein [Patescibacteria group bacterium]
MTKQQLQEALDNVVTATKKCYERGENMPFLLHVFVERDEGGRADLVFILGNKEAVDNRKQVLRDVGRNLAKDIRVLNRVVAIAVISEAWVSTVPFKDMAIDGHATTKKEYVQPSKDPKRKEALVISAQTRDHENVIRIYHIEREGGKASLKEIKSGFSKMEAPLLDEFWKGLLDFNNLNIA